MDALSDILRLVALTGAVYLDAELTSPWTISGRVAPEMCLPFMTPPKLVVSFHYVVEGEFELAAPGAPTCKVAAGEAVMLPRNDLHILGSTTARAPFPIGELIQPPNLNGISKIVHGGGGARTRIICGFVGADEQLEQLLSALPPVLKIPVASLPDGDWISRTFAYAAQTLSDGEPGAATVLAKVSELLFVDSIRRYLAGLAAEETGWLGALRDPVVGRGLALLHARASEDWTVEALARALNMSRSAFAGRFTELVGMPPMRYLLSWRMQLARHMLLQTENPIAQIAFEVGYDSEAAFTRAFRRTQGQPPAAWRRRSGR